jgi:hypothetical protein
MNPARFLRQLRHWTFHCLINALPSLIIAAVWMKLGKNPTALAAMFAAIATFIFLYATLTSLQGPLADDSHLFSKALGLGTRIRLWISGLSLIIVSAEEMLMFVPDLWCGMLSLALLNGAAQWLNPGSNAFRFMDGNSTTQGFFPVYATTLLEGFILSFILLMISFFALILIQIKNRRSHFTATRQSPPENPPNL